MHDEDGVVTSSIITASIHGRVNVVELLLSIGASINEKNSNGTSSIIGSCTIGNIEIVEVTSVKRS